MGDMHTILHEKLPVDIQVFLAQYYPELLEDPRYIGHLMALYGLYRTFHPELLLIETDKNGVITYVNQLFADLMGYSPHELLGQNANILRHSQVHPGVFSEMWNFYLLRGEPWRGRLLNRKKDFETCEIELVILPIFDAEGQPYKYLGMGYDTTREYEERQKSEFAKSMLEDSLQYARRIQRIILHNDDTLKRYFNDNFFLVANARDKVSGDFVWVGATLRRVVSAVVDCTGHGTSGAILTFFMHNFLNQIILQRHIDDPAQILSELHNSLRDLFVKENEGKEPPRDGADAAIIAIEKHDDILHFAGANRPLWIIRRGELIEIKGDKNSIGGEKLLERVVYTPKEIELQDGDMIYLFSDGIVDQFGEESKKKFGTKRLRELLLTIYTERPMRRQRARFNQVWKEWRGDEEMTDDSTLLGIHYVSS